MDGCVSGGEQVLDRVDDKPGVGGHDVVVLDVELEAVRDPPETCKLES